VEISRRHPGQREVHDQAVDHLVDLDVQLSDLLTHEPFGGGLTPRQSEHFSGLLRIEVVDIEDAAMRQQAFGRLAGATRKIGKDILFFRGEIIGQQTGSGIMKRGRARNFCDEARRFSADRRRRQRRPLAPDRPLSFRSPPPHNLAESGVGRQRAATARRSRSTRTTAEKKVRYGNPGGKHCDRRCRSPKARAQAETARA